MTSRTVIHYISSPDDFKNQVPVILKGDTPSSDNDLGTKDYSQKPVAVIMGSGLNPNGITATYEACKPILAIPWLKPDEGKSAPEVGTPEYAKAMVHRIKEDMAKLQSEGKLDQAGMYLY